VHELVPRALLHGDFKLSNVFVGARNGRVFAIDWQWLGGGCPAADLAYFVYPIVVVLFF
jgi:aminoglycoside phosphotransferase (APT) family kinase protein